MVILSRINKPKIDIALFGMDSNIPAIDKVHMMDEDSFELFTEEWLYGSKRTQYSSISRIGGAGDKGRDVIAECISGAVDYYQCKHYNSPLMPSEYYLELGKLCYYTYCKEIAMPRCYYIVASHDIGPTLSELLKDHDELKKALVDNWETYCEKRITKATNVKLEGNLLAYVQGFDFSVVKHYPISKVIDEHLQTIYGNIRFGGQRLQRPNELEVPAVVEQDEMKYIAALLEAYSDELKTEIDTVKALEAYEKYFRHFSRQRKDYYKAETIRRFVRDTLTNSNEFDILKDDIYDGIIDVHEKQYDSGYKRLIADLEQAVSVNTSRSLLDSRLHFVGSGERKGVCHMLANEDKLKWVDK